MKKIVIIVLFISILGIVSVPAETWQEFIDRAQIMEKNFRDGINRGNQNTWSYDKWGGLLATSYWLEDAYEDIYKNAPHLSQYERDIYRGLWQRRMTQSDDLKRLLDLSITSNSARRSIADWMDYWGKHLYEKGGTINFN